jgi:hypothetical protein
MAARLLTPTTLRWSTLYGEAVKRGKTFRTLEV